MSFELARQRAQKIEQRRKPPPIKTVLAPGSMEWFAEQEKARSNARLPLRHIPRRISSDKARQLSS
jgi:hypothetical protein